MRPLQEDKILLVFLGHLPLLLELLQEQLLELQEQLPLHELGGLRLGIGGPA